MTNKREGFQDYLALLAIEEQDPDPLVRQAQPST